MIPGIATWKPSICTLCPAGCGMLVRVMQGEAEVVRNGQLGILKMGLAKKLEGNPEAPDQPGQALPARPGRFAGDVPSGPHSRIRWRVPGRAARANSKRLRWDEAIKQLVAQLSRAAERASKKARFAFLTSPLRGQREQYRRWLSQRAFKSSPHRGICVFRRQVVRAANLRSFGMLSPPTVDLGQSNYVISFGADFLGTWNSPVAQSIAYGKMRKGTRRGSAASSCKWSRGCR